MAPKVILTRPLDPTLLEGGALLDRAEQDGKIQLVRWTQDKPVDRQWLLNELRKGGTEGLVCMHNGEKIDNELLDAAGPSLKVIATMSAGYDHVDTAALKKRCVRLGSTPDALTAATADVGAMLVLMASRRAGESVRAVIDGKWPSMPWNPLLLCGQSLKGSTVGILGFGKIGQLTLKRLLGFDVSRCLYSTSRPGVALDPSKDYFNTLATASFHGVELRPAESYDELARECDFLVTCCPLTPSTQGIIGASFLAKMKPTAYLVNTARGPVVDSDALLAALREKRLAGAGLDVVTGEPNIGADHPLVLEPSCVVLPHIGSATVQARSGMSRDAVKNCLAGVGVEGFEWANEVPL
ncbi:2-hydroxyacid dehydrogenase [Rhodotorula paludigena]|uniref:2-hydroxyacid dehydrogenase n=1 Tax=Rhodotorula paludigena TaxID=86838 RepID=UPI003178CD0E